MTRLWILGAWLALSLAWMAGDRLVEDGDEAGHVGAAELFDARLDRGEVAGFLDDAWRGDLGEYPPLVPAVVGLAWHLAGPGQPSRLPVRGVNLVGLLLAAWATGRLARELEAAAPGESRVVARGRARRAEAAAFAFVLALPLANGLSRHFMPEGWLVGAVAVAVLLAARAGSRPSAGRALALGLGLGAGLLVKQTFALLAALPVLWAGRRQGWRWLLTALAAGAVAGPWYARHLAEQAAYLGRSAAPEAPAPWAAVLAYYPAVTGWVGLGPVLSLLAAAGWLLALRRRRGGDPAARAAALLGLAWFLGGLAVLTLVPKRYPRLMAPLAPGAALAFAAAFARLRAGPGLAAAGLLAAFGWLGWASWHPVPPPGAVRALHARCIQTWLRPPVDDDLGIGAVVDAARAAPPGPVAVVDGPAIPCAVQTTHDWAWHLGPALRRAGGEREVRTVADPADAAGAAVVVDWRPEAAAGEVVAVPALGRVFRLRVARR